MGPKLHSAGKDFLRPMMTRTKTFFLSLLFCSALVTRGLGLLEGIALSGDPDFDIFRASAPFARRRAVALLGPRGMRRFTTTA
jgi:predicted unusual protein kinase regulating ubiquinone biosynthesis (AarF/ABC1/UbiB family)